MSVEELAGIAITALIVLLTLAGKVCGRRSEGDPAAGPPHINKKALPETVVLLVIVAVIWLLGR